jgi:hypothetical protein
MIDRRGFVALGALVAVLPAAARAHHGWRWVSDEDFTLSGLVRSVKLGNPHGIVEVEAADGAVWTAEIGQPWRNAAAGLPEDRLVPRAAITFEGHRAADPDERRMKAERVVFEGMRYTLYPDRD